MTWHIVGLLCMLNAPTDCRRIILDEPSYARADECADAIPLALYRAKRVMGSEWTEFGCVQK